MKGTHLLSVVQAEKRYVLSRRRQEVVAFTDVTFSLNVGETLAVLGPSGCGKSTLLKVVAGLERLTSGTVAIQGDDGATADAMIGMMFQEARLLPWLTVKENLFLPYRFSANAQNGEKEHWESAVEAMMERLGVRRFSDAYPTEISGGMAQRVALGRTLLRGPRLILFDEPFAALDALTRLNMQRWVATMIHEQKLSAIFVTHDIDEALYMGDKILMMSAHPGRVIECIENPVSSLRVPGDKRLDALRRDILNDFLARDHG